MRFVMCFLPPQVHQREVEHLPQRVQQVLLHRLARRQVVHSARLLHFHHLEDSHFEDLMIAGLRFGEKMALDLVLAKAPPLLLKALQSEKSH